LVKTWLGRIQSWLWIVLVVLLPITSMPLVVRLMKSDAVAAPSGLILFLLVLVWLIPYILKRGSFPSQFVPFLLFILAAVFSTAVGLISPAPPQKNADVLRSSFVAVLTLGVGTCFYLVASLWPESDQRLKLTLKILNWSGFAVLAWALAQAVAWYWLHRYPYWMRTFQDFISIGTLFRQRFVGFALEPSWLAHQLNMLYLPFWLASSIRRFSVHSWRIGPFSFENFLLVGGATVLLLTLSRVGLLAFLMMIAYWALLRAFQFISRLRVQAIEKWSGRLNNGWRRMLLSVFMIGGLLLVFLGILIGLGYILSQLDVRMANLFQLDISKQVDPVAYIAQQLSLAARLVYWKSGWEVFNNYPWMGVGLGKAGYFMPDYLDGYAWRLAEVRGLMFRSDNLLNIKSLWIRVLAETGAVGFAFLGTWLYTNWHTAQKMQLSDNSLTKVLGSMGGFVLIGLLLEGFSLDTFALPYIWFSLGLLTAGFRVEYNH
jgi:hypothetical protein